MAKNREELLIAREILKLRVADEILTLLEEKGIKKSFLAKGLDKSRSRVSHILNGESNLTLSTLSDIAGVLDCEIEVKFKDLNKKFVPLENHVFVKPMLGIYGQVFDYHDGETSFDLAG